MNRRQFFKTAAAAVVAPAVVRGNPGIDCNAPIKWTTVDCSPPFKTNQAQTIILDKFTKQFEWAMFHDPLIRFPVVRGN